MLNRINNAWRMVRDVGLRALWYYAAYQIGLRSGYYRWRTPAIGIDPDPVAAGAGNLPALNLILFQAPPASELESLLGSGAVDLMTEADEIAAGRVRLFGGQPQPLEVVCWHPRQHWSELEGKPHRDDIKKIWETARFGWVFTLGRAYRLNHDERYPAAFWRVWEQFRRQNPYNHGENWLSGQEVALRLIGLVFAAQVFRDSFHSTPERIACLTAAMIDHARRVAATPAYAHAQNNNHLLSEAVGLITAAFILPDWKETADWRRSGWRRFYRAAQCQINADGEYIQYSVNYHRLAMHLALLADRVARLEGNPLPEKVRQKLSLAAHWLAGVMDEISGRAIQLGHHDGAHLLPLDGGGITDYRAALQAGLGAFDGQRALPPGKWDELCAWLGIVLPEEARLTPPRLSGIRRLGNPQSWACLRAAKFTSRPAHADQLQVHIWHHGQPLVLDAGTFAYNLPPPWQNGLAGAEIHNAPVINGKQPMIRAGKFHWLEWDQAEFLPGGLAEEQQVRAARSGYRRIGVNQCRTLEQRAGGDWLVRDELLPTHQPGKPYRARLHWLVADGIWQMEARGCSVRYDHLRLAVRVRWSGGELENLRLARAGGVVAGEEGDFSCFGWYSPTYLTRLPALSLVLDFIVHLPAQIETSFAITAD
ncbi:MAG: heparinase II/III family protein [Bellilinea sp.]|jgi:hypothetical protein